MRCEMCFKEVDVLHGIDMISLCDNCVKLKEKKKGCGDRRPTVGGSMYTCGEEDRFEVTTYCLKCEVLQKGIKNEN